MTSGGVDIVQSGAGGLVPRAAKRLVRHPRQALRTLKWQPQLRRLESIGSIGSGRRAFLVGCGPSLAEMDLSTLKGEFVCAANMAIRGVGDLLPHADMHIMTDPYGYARFASEIERLALDHSIGYRFLNYRARKIWRQLETKAAEEPIYFVPHTAKILELDAIPPVEEGIANGPSVLIPGAILLRHLGFDPIYILGCDLNYETNGPYFYPMREADLQHEADVVDRDGRRGISEVDRHFAVLRRDFERQGLRLVNAGLGGNLSSLPRAPLDGLFPRAMARMEVGKPHAERQEERLAAL